MKQSLWLKQTKKKSGESKMAEEYVDIKNISLHRYIRNPPPDTDVHPKHPAEGGQEELTSGKEYIERKTQQDKGSGGKTGVLVGLDLPLVGGKAEAGV